MHAATTQGHCDTSGSAQTPSLHTSHVAQPIVVVPQWVALLHASPTCLTAVHGEFSPDGQYSPVPHEQGVNVSASVITPPALQ